MLASVCLPAQAQTTLLGEFSLQGSLVNNVAGGPSLALLPYASVSGTVTSSGYVFQEDQGLTFSSPSLSPTDFSIELSFRLDATSGYRKITDFRALGDDTGFYELNGNLNFYNVVTASTADFSPAVDVDVVLTRDGATNTVNGYVNGALRFTFVDTSLLAKVTAANNTLTFFVDDPATGQNEASGGTLNYLRIYNGALTAGQVTALYAQGAASAVPEPAATSLLLALAALGGFVARRHRRSKSVRAAA